MHSELNSVCIRHLCFCGLLLRRAKTAIGVLEDMLLFPAILVYFLYQKWYLYVIGREFEGA